MSPTTAGGASVAMPHGRQGLRLATMLCGAGSDDAPARIVRVDPADGARGVFRDAPVVAVVSRPIDIPSLNDDSFAVLDYANGRVPGRVDSSPDRRVLVWVPQRPLTPGVEHLVRVAGLRDARGRTVEPHESTFVPCDVTLADL